MVNKVHRQGHSFTAPCIVLPNNPYIIIVAAVGISESQACWDTYCCSCSASGCNASLEEDDGGCNGCMMAAAMDVLAITWDICTYNSYLYILNPIIVVIMVAISS